MQSHIQMPRLILNNFTDQFHSLHYYGYENNVFGKCSPKSFYTECDYYSKEVEDFLGSKIESNLGEMIRFIKDTELTEGIRIPKEFEGISHDYVISLMGRSPFLLERIKKKSTYFQFLPAQDEHDYAVVETYNMIKQNGTLGNYSLAFVDNKSSEEFILPTGGIIQVGDSLICPVTPHKAIDLELRKEEEYNGRIKILLIEDRDVVRKINIAAFDQELSKDRKYVVSTSKELLKVILEQYNCMKGV